MLAPVPGKNAPPLDSDPVAAIRQVAGWRQNRWDRPPAPCGMLEQLLPYHRLAAVRVRDRFGLQAKRGSAPRPVSGPRALPQDHWPSAWLFPSTGGLPPNRRCVEYRPTTPDPVRVDGRE